MSTKVKAARWGNSIAVRLPRRAVEALGITAGQEMEFEVKGQVMELTPSAPRRLTLAEIVAEMKRLGPDAEPKTVEWGPNRGDEIIQDEWSSR